MVWGGITAHNRTQLVIIDGNLNAEKYRDEILIPVVFRSYNAMALVSFYNRTTPARIVQQLLQQQETDILPWPAASLDLSPIEHVWDEIKRRLQRLPQAPVTLQELRQQLVRIWNEIPQNFHAQLFASMRRRCTAVIDAKGGHTRY